MNLQSFDWRSLKKYFGPQAANDLNHFLEKLPAKAGNAVLIAAGIAWATAAALGLYTTVQMQALTELRAEFKETSALKPIVPKIRKVPVKADSVKSFVEDLERTYSGLKIKQQGTAIAISAQTTANFGEFREAVGHIQNGGSGWSVSVDRLCVGRECKKEKLAAVLKINKVSVDKPKQ